MIVVRNCLTAKPGHATRLAAQLKDAAGAAWIPATACPVFLETMKGYTDVWVTGHREILQIA